MSEQFTLANLNHLGVFFTILLLQGAVCSKCGHGTRYTSKRWARCKKCDERVRRRTDEEVQEALERIRSD